MEPFVVIVGSQDGRVNKTLDVNTDDLSASCLQLTVVVIYTQTPLIP